MAPVRPFSPGEGQSSSLGFRNEALFLSRPFVGQITSVDEDNGTAEVIALQLGSPVTLPLPFAGMSVNRNESSWIRYMPQKGDFVILSYSLDNKPEIMGYTLHGNNPTADAKAGKYVSRVGGYKTVRQLKDRADTGEQVRETDNRGVTTSIPIGLRDFIPLKSGEWDLKSKGGAYVHGSRFGELTLSGGPNLIRIDKIREEIVAKTNLYHFDASSETFFRLGDVKRKLTEISPTESNVPGAAKELHIRVSKNIGTEAVPVYVETYDMRAGDVRDDDTLGLIPLLPPAVLNERVSAPTALNQTLYERKVSETGTYSEAVKSATGVDLHSRNVSDIGVVDFSATAGLNLVVGPPGTPVTQSIVRGDALSLWMMTQLSVLTAFGPSGPAVAPLTPGIVLHSLAKIT